MQLSLIKHSKHNQKHPKTGNHPRVASFKHAASLRQLQTRRNHLSSLSRLATLQRKALGQINVSYQHKFARESSNKTTKKLKKAHEDNFRDRSN
jgi:tRNA G37 N-methylase TrmD